MTVDELTFDEITRYLFLTSWTVRNQGEAGILFEKNVAERPQILPVPHTPFPIGIKWIDLLDQLSDYEQTTTSNLYFKIKNPHVDVARVRAADDILIRETIPLSAGVGLLRFAHRMLRASATTSRKTRPQIGSGYSKIGDEIVSTARVGHSEMGSYIMPILMPLTFNTESKFEHEELVFEDGERRAPEPTERRVMRTFAESLAALNETIVQPGKAPKLSSMDYLVHSGVSHEFVNAITELLEEKSVATFDTSFQWSPMAEIANTLPTSISIPSGAVELLEQTAKLLKKTQRDPIQTYTGPIVEVRHRPEDEIGMIGMQVFRGNRTSEIKVTLKRDQIQKALEWMKLSKTVVVVGNVLKDPGKPLRIDRPVRFNTLEEERIV